MRNIEQSFQDAVEQTQSSVEVGRSARSYLHRGRFIDRGLCVDKTVVTINKGGAEHNFQLVGL